ncbi:MAG TPA: DNA alkylation repair protein [Candidatus Limnocylindrales bacterium]|nr:DNA alkylation repair protein [Candidatus Limnocylindrales bacterium]
MFTTSSVLEALEAAGSAQTRKTYRRHGVGENQYGVSYAMLGALEKQIRREKDPARDHQIALDLWATGNHDARVLALRLADPKRADEALLNGWVRDLDNYVITDAFSSFAAKTAHAQPLAYKWIDADSEWIEAAGWNVLGQLAFNGALPDADCARLLPRIEGQLHASKNRVRYAMNNVIISIGGRGGELASAATAAAQRIGLVIVDHGETGCKTPDAAPYIERILARKGAQVVKPG